MIKLAAVPPPVELTPDAVKELTEKFKQNKKESVWQQDYIKKALLEMSNSKCCYCECEVNVAGSDLHVEHFHPKDLYPDEVIEWSNLLPACTRCNRRKGKLDTKTKSIIHPVKHNPKNHIEFKKKLLLLSGKDDLGVFTIERLELDTDERLAVDRYRLALAITNQLKKLFNGFVEALNTKPILTNSKKEKFQRELRGIMQYGTSDKKYSAVISSVILTDDNYQEIKRLFETHDDLWNDEFIELEEQVNYCALI